MFRTLVLSMILDGKMTEKQYQYILNWVRDNAKPHEYAKYAKIAWQYGADELSEKIKNM